MKALVTGAAGFIGSHLVERLLADQHEVLAVDCFTPYYERTRKEENLTAVRSHPRLKVVEADVATADLSSLISGIDTVFHLAAQPGVRLSWDAGFPNYVRHNVLATQRLLEAVRTSGARVVYASSSSIYGNAVRYPTTEEDLPRPHSPYGVTKLAAEHLCTAYAENWGVSTVALRYFTVYGPRQRPDMAMHRLIEAALSRDAFPLYGTGEQVRDFTYVDDVVAANLAAATGDLPPGATMNIAGGTSASVRAVIELVSQLTEIDVALDLQPGAPGDVHRTGGAIDRAQELLGWKPQTSLRSGLEAQVRWHQDRRSAVGGAT